jgi:thiamine biosynthesis lipoprotein
MSATGALVAPPQRRTFSAMGTSVELMLAGSPTPRSSAALLAAEAEFHRLERIFSRFLPSSELSALNEAGQMEVGPELLEVTEIALAARERTGGRFDPTVHDALVAAGYDCTFDRLRHHASTDVAVAEPQPCQGSVQVDRATSTVELGRGVRLDFGGIAKGYAADRACELIAEHGPCLVNAGGDVRVHGGLDGGPWPVGVETPQGTVSLGLTDCGLATSGRDRRRWSRDGEERHHLIDPSTGRSSESDVVRVTAIAPCAVEAEIRAKQLFLAGELAAMAEADELAYPSVLVTSDGRAIFAGGLT